MSTMIPLGDDNPSRDNPYASPESQDSPALVESLPLQPPNRGLIRHVRVVAILMIAQGTLEVFMGFGWIGMAVLWPQIQGEMARRGGPAGGPMPPAMPWIVLAMWGFFGLVVLCLAGLHIVAGIRNYMFRSRILGIVALIAGMLTTVFGCYCAPTAIALGIYGLVCYMNLDVVQWFDLITRSRGRAPVALSDR